MIEDGRAFGATLALKHILGLLVRKGLTQPPGRSFAALGVISGR